MKKITRLLLLAAIAIGMVACSNDDNLPDAPDANAAKGNTYASISIKLPKGPSTRAGLPDDTWKGIDAIETITVFLVNTEGDPTVDFKSFTKDSFDGIDSQGILFPNVALKATAEHKVKAYVVLNGESEILGTLQDATAVDFDDVYNDVISKIASELAKNEAGKDVIMMTNTVAPAEMTVKAGVTEGEAMTGSVNTFFVEVERVVSRAIATVKAGTHTIPVLNYLGEVGSGSIITIKDLKYVVGQSNKEFYMIKQKDYVTPESVYNFVPTAENWMTAVKGDNAIFDNTGLADAKRSTVLDATGGTALTQFEAALTRELADSKFVLPVTHADKKYRKGNTTFFEVIAIFTPDLVDGVKYTAGADVFLGMKDGLFYSTRESAEAKGQKATHYKGDGNKTDGGAIMKYVLWLNPDVIPGSKTGKTSMSPTVRNQVYHAHINKFMQIGLPNNPLNPDDPNDPLNPKNPIKPTDPLETEDTYLSVEITVLPWGIHSYEIDLGNDY